MAPNSQCLGPSPSPRIQSFRKLGSGAPPGVWPCYRLGFRFGLGNQGHPRPYSRCVLGRVVGSENDKDGLLSQGCMGADVTGWGAPSPSILLMVLETSAPSLSKCRTWSMACRGHRLDMSPLLMLCYAPPRHQEPDSAYCKGNRGDMWCLEYVWAKGTCAPGPLILLPDGHH